MKTQYYDPTIQKDLIQILREQIEHECNQLKIWEDKQEDAVIQVSRIKSDLVIHYGQYMDAMKDY